MEGETLVQEEIVAVTFGDDTLTAVLCTVNKSVCVREMLWRMFCIKETAPKCGPMAGSPFCITCLPPTSHCAVL